MVQLSTTEHVLIDELLECLATAVDRTNVDPAYANKTKLQKLLYLAIDEFNLPLTYSWYLAGAIVPGDSVSPAKLQTAFEDLPSTEQPTVPSTESPSDTSDASTQPNSDETVSDAKVNETVADFKGELQSGDTDPEIDPVLFADPSEVVDHPDYTSQEGLGDRRADVIDFYERKLPDVWHQSTMQFLQNFYLTHAPDEYRDLYVQSTHLRTRLSEVEAVIAHHLNGEQPGQNLSSLSKAVGLEVSDLHYSLRKIDSLGATLTDVSRGTDLIEDGLMMLSQLDPDKLTETHREIVAEMQEFFYYGTWRLPCLVISQETATGPSAGTLRARRQEQLASFDGRLREKCCEFERTLEQADLNPTYADYEIAGDEVDQAAAELTEKYLK